jgi:macrolide-specific efflux system membrane fusion protein
VTRRRALIIVAIGLAISAAAWFRPGAQAKDPFSDVMLASATRGDVIQVVQASGTLRPTNLVAVGSQSSGRITSLRVKTGQAVQKGELLAVIDSLTQENDIKTAEAVLADARAQKVQKQAALSYAEAVLTRQKAALAQNATSKDAYESAKSTVDVNRAQLESLDAQIAQAEVKVKTAKVSLDYTRIVAPMDGVILLVVAQEGQTLNAVQSAPTVVVLGQIDMMRVRAEISEADVAKVHVGMAASFSILGDPSRRWSGTLAAIDPAPDNIRSDAAITSNSATASSSSSSSSSSSAVYYYGYFDVPNPDGLLKTYMTAQVSIMLGEVKNVVLAPTAALSPMRDDGSRTVDVATSEGQLESRKVLVGLDDKVHFEARAGLNEGERVVIGRRDPALKSNLPGPPGGL